MKFHKATLLTAAAVCATSMAFAGGPDYYHSHWGMEATVLGGVNYTTAQFRNWTLPNVNRGSYTNVSLSGWGGEAAAQIGVVYDHDLSFGFNFDENAADVKGGSNLANMNQRIRSLTSIGGYADYKFMHYGHHAMSILGTMNATTWDLYFRENAFGSYTRDVSKVGLSEGLGLRYQYQFSKNVAAVAQMMTNFYQLNAKVFMSNELIRMRGRNNTAFSSSIMGGVNYQFAL